jgi:hypothetical protein
MQLGVSNSNRPSLLKLAGENKAGPHWYPIIPAEQGPVKENNDQTQIYGNSIISKTACQLITYLV